MSQAQLHHHRVCTTHRSSSMLRHMVGRVASSGQALRPSGAGVLLRGLVGPGAAGHRRRGVVSVAASWGAPVTWNPAVVVATRREAEGLQLLHVKLPPAVASGSTAPGQYVQVRTQETDKPAFIAVASPVGSAPDGVVELLVKSVPGATAEALCALPVGASLQVSDVQGAGFQLQQRLPAEAFPDVYVFATGSGLAPIRSLLDTPERLGGLAGSGRTVRLYVGVRSPAHLPFAGRLEAWEAAGVHVRRVYSQTAGGQHAQYVQEAFTADGGVATPSGSTGAVIVGQKAAFESLAAAFAAAGVPKERMLSNF